MKNVFLILMLLGGFAIEQLDAQKCCVPCPPGCCITSCKPAGNRGSAAVTNEQAAQVAFASFMLPNENPACQPVCLSKKEAKACQAVVGQIAPSDLIHTADSSMSTPNAGVGVASTPSCQPVAKVHTGCQPAPTSSVTAAATQERVKLKS